jgi:dTDP-4-dehydrorhamnose reductase
VTRILVTGRAGQVGTELTRTLAPLGAVTALDRAAMDLSDPDSIRRAIRDARPEIIVNAAAYTAVDKAESERDLAMRVNGIAPGVMAEEGRRLGAILVHYSTDYVFDGRGNAPYSEDHPPNPINVYGHTKLAGERAIRAAGGRWFVLRTSWVYASRGQNFLRTILRLASERDRLRIVDDQIGAPTWSRTIAEATAQVIARVSPPASAESAPPPSGIYNLCSAGHTSWFGFARAILERAPASLVPRKPVLEPIRAEQYPTPAARPANSRLSLDKIAATFGLAMPPWQEALDLCIEELARQG